MPALETYENVYARRRDMLLPIYPQSMVPSLIHVPQQFPDGRQGLHTYINPVWDAVKAYYMPTAPAAPALAGGGLAGVGITTPAEENLRGDYEIFGLMALSTGRFSVMMTHQGLNKRLMNQPVANNLVFGDGRFPGRPFESIFLETNMTLSFALTDLTGLANTIRISTTGRRFLNYDLPGLDKASIAEAFYRRRSHPYWLTFDAGPEVVVGAGLTATFAMTVPGSCDFESAYALDDSTGDYLIEVFEGRSGRSLMDGPIHRQHFAGVSQPGVAGTGTFPAAGLPMTYLQTTGFKRQTILTVRITDLSGAPNTIRLAFHGRALYYDEVGRPPVSGMETLLSPIPRAVRGAGTPLGFPPAGYPFSPDYGSRGPVPPQPERRRFGGG